MSDLEPSMGPRPTPISPPESKVPLVRRVHDHDIYCLRSYKYDYFTRKICTRPASLACLVPYLEGRVHFKGFIPQDELKGYYRECSVVALSSVWPEPIATIGLEVMRYALPVVAFDAGGIKDWLADGHNGYLVPWMDRAAFAGRVDALLQDKSLARRLGENGLRLVSERYDFDGYIRDLEGLFAEVSGERGRR